MKALHMLVIAAALATLAAGCIAIPNSSTRAGNTPTAGSLLVLAQWGPWQDDPMPHLLLTLTHRGGTSVDVGPGGSPIVVTGPNGTVPINWGSMTGPQALSGEDSVTLALHPRGDANGTFTLSMDHAWGTPLRGPSGMYFVCIGDDCTNAKLT